MFIDNFFSESGDTPEKTEQSAEDPNQAQSEAQLALAQFWPKVMEEIKSVGNVYNLHYIR